MSSFQFDRGFYLSVDTYLADTAGRSKERRIAWYSDYANYFYLRYDQIVEQFVCLCVINEQWVFYSSADVEASEWNGYDEEWHNLALEINDDHLQALRDGEVIFELTDSMLLDMPRTGYIDLSNTFLETCFDNIWLVSYEEQYVCGDTNGDSVVNVSDAVYLINYVFLGGNPPDPFDSGDCNCDGMVNISDAVMIINYIFIGGNTPCDNNGDDISDC